MISPYSKKNVKNNKSRKLIYNDNQAMDVDEPNNDNQAMDVDE